MSIEENEAVVRRSIGMWDNRKYHWDDRQDSGGWLEVFSPDVIVRHATHEIRGVDAYQAALGPFFAAFPDIDSTIHELVAQGEIVAARLSWTATHENEYQGIPASGNRVDVTAMWFFRVVGGKILEAWGNEDVLGLLTQIGSMPASAEA